MRGLNIADAGRLWISEFAYVAHASIVSHTSVFAYDETSVFAHVAHASIVSNTAKRRRRCAHKHLGGAGWYVGARGYDRDIHIGLFYASSGRTCQYAAAMSLQVKRALYGASQ